MKELYAKLFGNVYNDVFKEFVIHKAREYHVTGLLQKPEELNEEECVEIVAQGNDADVRMFLESISAGTEGAEVDSLNVSWGPIETVMQGFEIK